MKKKISHKNAAVYIFNKELKAILVHQRAGRKKNFHTQYLPLEVRKKGEKESKKLPLEKLKKKLGLYYKKVN